MDIKDFQEKLNKLNALQKGAKTEGEKQSAIKAKARLLRKMKSCNPDISSQEYKFSLKNSTNLEIFINILKKYELNEYRKSKYGDPVILAKVPGYFVDNILWPEYKSYFNSNYS